MKIHLSLILGLLVVFSTPSLADTVGYTNSAAVVTTNINGVIGMSEWQNVIASRTNSLPKFNPSLGTLTSVTILIDIESYAEFDSSNDWVAATAYTYPHGYLRNLVGPGFTQYTEQDLVASGDYGLNRSGWWELTGGLAYGSASPETYLTEGLDVFLGSGNWEFTYDLEAFLGLEPEIGNGSYWLYDGLYSTTVTISVIYEYEPD